MSNTYFKELKEKGVECKFPVKFFFCNETVTIEDSIKLYVNDYIEKLLKKDPACHGAVGLIIYLDLFEFDRNEKDDLEDPESQYSPIQVRYSIETKESNYDVSFDLMNTKEVVLLNVYHLVVKSIRQENPNLDLENETGQD